MTIQKIKINPGKMTKEGMILYYLFVDEQLLCAWWDYLDYWHEERLYEEYETDGELKEKMKETIDYVDYWEDILDQLKEYITFADIEEYLAENPHVKKSYLFIRT